MTSAPTRIEIDLSALRANYRLLRRASRGAETAGVVKADAYGLGVAPVARALRAEGCRVFFTALAQEGAALRALLPEAKIYVLSAVFPQDIPILKSADLRPCLYSPESARQWRETGLRSALHIETGIHRLGLTLPEAQSLQGLEPDFVMSHLACADDPTHPMNAAQVTAFQAIRTRFPGVPGSLVNSAGILMESGIQQDLTRPGIALYGSDPHDRNRMQAVARLLAPIAQIRTLPAGASVGYGASAVCQVQTRIAIIPIGYADGIPRAASLNNGDYACNINGFRAPIMGRISMDMTCLDVTHIPENRIHTGMDTEIYGPAASIDALAAQANTIAYEILTRAAPRSKRLYLGA